MKLRTTMLIGIAVLVAAIVGATVLAVARIVEDAAREELEHSLDRANAVLAEQLAARHAQLRSDCRVVANEPRLRAVVATQDISRETVVGVITELRASLGSDLFLLTDGTGGLVADAADPAAAGHDMTGQPGIAAALEGGEGAGVWLAEARPHLVQACRIDFGGRAVGAVAIGRVFDDAAADALYRQTGATIVVTLDWSAIAASRLASGRRADPGQLDGVVAALGGARGEATIAGDRYVGVTGRFPRYEGKRELRVAILRSLDEALAPGRALIQSVLVIAGIALLAGLGLALLLARGLARPVGALVEVTRRIAGGDLRARARPAGATEIRELALAMNHMTGELDESRRALADKERLERELEIATRIQTSMLPRSFDVHGLEIAARMIPASEVGGDYYDILPIRGGCWIGIGDVAGHGLTAGLEMMMVQSVVAALVRENPAASPRDHLRVLNHVIYDNIRNRLDQDEHITLTLLKYDVNGTVRFAGAHEELVVYRSAGGRCERIPTPGTWLGAVRDITRVTEETTLELAPGDVLVLYTDGITEAKGADGRMFGMERLCELVEAARAEPVETIRDRVIAAVQAWEVEQEDDISVVVIRRAQD